MDAVDGHNKTQTRDMKWLHIKEVYQKLFKQGEYDIGGTYSDNVADYWFMFQTDNFGDNFMLHIFIINRNKTSFSLSISSHSELTHDHAKKNQAKRSHLPLSLATQHYVDIPDNTCTFVTTYSFTSSDVDKLENRELFIAVKLSQTVSQLPDFNIVKAVKLKHNLGSWSPIGSDFTIESAEGQTFAVHKAILATQSEVFRAMLQEDTAESRNGCVKLSGAAAKELECLLHYMYTGNVESVASCDMRILLELADQYDLPGLVLFAAAALRRQLSVDNVFEVAAVADMFNSKLLKSATSKFVKDHPEVLRSECWKSLKNVDVVKNLYEF